MSIQETAANCLSILDRHEADRPSYGLSPAERQRLLLAGVMAVLPVLPSGQYRYRRKPVLAGQKAYGAIADYARDLVMHGYTDSIVALASRIGVAPNTLAQSLANARKELAVSAQHRTCSSAVREAVAECLATPYVHGMFAAVARKHGADPRLVQWHLKQKGISRRGMMRDQLKKAA